MSRKSILQTFLIASVTAASGITLAANSEYEQWLKQTQETFQEYKDKRDKEFMGFLQKQWKEMQVQSGFVLDKTPKPVSAPKVKAIETPVAKPKQQAVIVKVPEFKPVPPPKVVLPQAIKPVKEPTTTFQKPSATEPVPSVSLDGMDKLDTLPSMDFEQPKTVEPAKPEQAPAQVAKTAPAAKVSLPPGRQISVNFFGNNLMFSYDPKMQQSVRGRITKDTISQFWSRLSQSDYESLQKQFDSKRKPLALNDWSYAVLVDKVAEQIYPGQADAQNMFTWFFLTKAGYKARIAYNDNGLFMLLPAKQRVYRAPFFTYDGVRYYSLKFDGSKSVALRNLYTYDGNYPGANQTLDLEVRQSLVTARADKRKVLHFEYGGKKYKVDVDYDRNTVDFFNTYPLLDFEVYFNAKVNDTTGHPILNQLGKIVNGKSQEEAVNILLRFTQTAFEYKDDQRQFGAENYLFPEETLHYTYSDCEDRVFFFSWLVHNLLGLQVVGLKYPGHFSAAVKFTEKVGGQYVTYKGTRFTLADPTYKNARAGVPVPEHKKALPRVITF